MRKDGGNRAVDREPEGQKGGGVMDLFDIIGPVMIGPSSSHTAGAARIGRVARRLLGEPLSQAVIVFHGSFAKTWKGHGTDRAIIGGLLDMEVDDTRLRDSLSIAEREGLSFMFSMTEIRGAHPNTVLVHAVGQSGAQLRVQGASIGGGRIRIQSIDGLEVSFSGEKDTLIVRHRDMPGVIAKATGLIAKAEVNIAAMRVFREEEGGLAVMVLELDARPDAGTIEAMASIQHVQRATFLERR